MAQDFKANQIRTSQIIVSGSNSSNAGLLIYGSSSATNAVGGYPSALRSGIGSDVFVFVSGSRDGSATTLFGGTVFVSGTLTANDQLNIIGDVGSNIVPSVTNNYDLGAPPRQWKNVYSTTGTFSDLVVSNNAKLGNGSTDYHQVTGTLDVLNNALYRSGLSGSLQRTTTGLSYLVAGAGVTIVSASNGQITITSTGGGGVGGSNTQVQFNDAGVLNGDDGLVYVKTTKTLSVGNLYVTGSITALTTSNLTISDPVIYLASGSVGPNVKSVIAFASGSTEADKSLIFGSLGSSNILAAARLDVQAGEISQSSLTFTDLIPIRASKFEIGGSTAALSSSDGQSVTLYSGGGSSIRIAPGSEGIMVGSQPQPGVDSYFFVSGSTMSLKTSTRGAAVFGGDLFISGAFSQGLGNSVTGLLSNAIGSSNSAIGDYSHAVGFSTIASGNYSYAGGQGTIASGSYQHVVGRFNKRNDSTSLFVVGNGTSDTDANRSDVFRVRPGTLNNGDVEVTGSFNIIGTYYQEAPETPEAFVIKNSAALGSPQENLFFIDSDAPNISFYGAPTRHFEVISYSTADMVLFLSGSGAATSPDPRNFSDVNFYVSGSNTRQSLFGGNIVSSGSISIKDASQSTVFIATTAGDLSCSNQLSIGGNSVIGNSSTNTIQIRSSLSSNLIPDDDMQRNLGSPSKRFANVYTGDLHLRNDRGDYTLIEEADCLTIRFNKTGKRYKFLLEPAPEFDE